MIATIDFHKAIPLADAIRQVAPLVKVSPATMRRWATHGVSGVKLGAASMGSLWVTTPEAVREFFGRCTAAKQRDGMAGDRAMVDAAHERLAEDGFGGKRKRAVPR